MATGSRVSRIFFILLGSSLLVSLLIYVIPGSIFIADYLKFITLILFAGTGVLSIFFVTEQLIPGSGTMMSDKEKTDSRPADEKIKVG